MGAPCHHQAGQLDFLVEHHRFHGWADDRSSWRVCRRDVRREDDLLKTTGGAIWPDAARAPRLVPLPPKLFCVRSSLRLPVAAAVLRTAQRGRPCATVGRKSELGAPASRSACRSVTIARFCAVPWECSPPWGKPSPRRTAPLQRPAAPPSNSVIDHPDRALRSRLARRVEDLKSQWLRRLRLADEWKSPTGRSNIGVAAPGLVPNTHGLCMKGTAAPSRCKSIASGRSRSLQSAEFDWRSLSGPVSRVCLSGSASSKAGKSFHQPPSWLIEVGSPHEDVTARGGRRGRRRPLRPGIETRKPAQT